MSIDDFDEVTQKLRQVFTDILGASITTDLRLDYYPEIKFISGVGLDIFEVSAMRIWRTDRLSLNDNFYNKQSVLNDLEEIELKLTQALTLFNKLPVEVSLEIEAAIKKRIPLTPEFEFGAATFGSKEKADEFASLFEKWAFGRPFYSLLKLIHNVLQETDVYGKGDYSFHLINSKEAAFSEVAKNINPQRDVNLDRSGNRVKKVLIIDELRFLWNVYYQTEAPKSIPYEGSNFGDLVDSTFQALGIKADARAAVDAWRIEFDT